MRLSESRNFKEYDRRRAANDPDGALQYLQACLNELQGPQIHERTFVLQLLANLLLSLGRRSEAFEYQATALNLEPTSLLTKLNYAMFLSSADDLSRAVSECDAIIDSALKQPFSETEEDFGREHYLRRAQQLKADCLKRASNMRSA